MDNKTMTGITIVAVCVAVAAGPLVLEKVHAETANFSLPDFNLNKLSWDLPQPLQDFINSAKQISGNLAGRTGNLTVQSFSAADIWSKINAWFANATGGISLTQIVKTIGNLFVWVLTAAANILKWLLSLI